MGIRLSLDRDRSKCLPLMLGCRLKGHVSHMIMLKSGQDMKGPPKSLLCALCTIVFLHENKIIS